jgi:ABC-type multidrug transport system fused ATPase/permease subunit
MLIVLLATVALQLLTPQISRQFIDGAQSGKPVQDLVGLALLFITLAILIQSSMVATVFFSERVGWAASNELRGDLALHALKLDSKFHTVHTPGELTERVDGDVNTLSNFFSQFIMQVVGSVILLAGVLILLARVDWRLGLVYVIYTGTYLGIAFRIRGSAIPRWTASRRAAADFSGFIEERINGIEDIRTNGLAPHTMHQFHRLVRTRYGLDRIASLVSAKVSAALIATITLNFAVAYLLTAHLFVEGSISLGTSFLVIQYSVLLNQPLFQFASQIEDLQKVGGSVSRINELMLTTSQITDEGDGELPRGPLSIEFNQVSFGYDPTTIVLEDVSFRLEAGQTLGVFGRTGSGKSTLARLLLRLYEPTNGVIYLADRPVRSMRLGRVQKHIGMVTQDVHLFHATLRDNISLFDATISDEQILDALHALGLGKWYSSLAKGLDTELSSDGSGLSGGEAQLVAFARIFLRNPSIVILDEPTSRLDPVTERHLEQALDQLLCDRTVVIVAHRLSTLARTDFVMMLENGKVAEFGSRDQLASDPTSHFARLTAHGTDAYLG